MATASRASWRTAARVGLLTSLVASTTPDISPLATCRIDTLARGVSLWAPKRTSFWKYGASPAAGICAKALPANSRAAAVVAKVAVNLVS